MANRRLYNEKSFLVKIVLDFKDSEVWHLVGRFTDGSIVSKYSESEFRIRVKPDPRWRGAHKVAFRADRVYECESIGYHSRRHIYGSGQWYISPYRPKENPYGVPGEFTFDDFDVTMRAEVIHRDI